MLFVELIILRQMFPEGLCETEKNMASINYCADYFMSYNLLSKLK